MNRLLVFAAALFLAAATAWSEEEKSPDPIGDIAADMKAATNWLAKWTTDVTTQQTQKDAVDKLDKLIAELEQECDKCRGGRARANPSKPARDSTVKSGPGGMGNLHSANENGKHWADLPPRERERILQSMTEGFPADYQNVLEAYFKRVAEEKPVKSDEQTTSTDSARASDAPSSPQPAPVTAGQATK